MPNTCFGIENNSFPVRFLIAVKIDVFRDRFIAMAIANPAFVENWQVWEKASFLNAMLAPKPPDRMSFFPSGPGYTTNQPVEFFRYHFRESSSHKGKAEPVTPIVSLFSSDLRHAPPVRKQNCVIISKPDNISVGIIHAKVPGHW